MTDDERQFENFVRQTEFDDTPDPNHRDRLERHLLRALGKRPPRQIEFWRIAMKSKITKLAAAAVILIAVVLSVAILDKSIPSAYALEQTIDAIKSVRFMHIVRGPRENKDYGDERWIEIMPDGSQGRYRQHMPPRLFVVDDRKTVFAYRENKNTVVLYDPNDQSFTWYGNPGKWLAELADGNLTPIVEEYVDYKGRAAHLVRDPRTSRKVYIDTQTKLPIAYGGYDITYEEPPKGTFDIPPVPEGAILVDKRPGAELTEEPEWMKRKTESDKKLDEHDEKCAPLFREAMHKLAEGKYEEAAELLTVVVDLQPMRNWVWHWLGKAYYELGQYEKAIVMYSVWCRGGTLSCYNLARGRAYRKLGMEMAARKDFEIALEAMVKSLRDMDSMKARLFDYAEDPLYRYDKQRRPSEKESFTKMVYRLREVTGENFGYDRSLDTPEEIERVISAWEDWWSAHAPDYLVVGP
ncbi:MAG TPA: tetratricopeptide repeat protein [Sedimentisphaerales bacterium]|nr:tetratricopeptide repeat protein [Sedimentisphaerales bacterium]